MYRCARTCVCVCTHACAFTTRVHTCTCVHTFPPSRFTHRTRQQVNAHPGPVLAVNTETRDAQRPTDNPQVTVSVVAQSPLPQNSALPLPAQARGPATLTPDRTLLRTGPPRRLTPRKQCQRQGRPPVSRRHLGPLCSRSLSRCFSGQTGPTFHGQLCFSHQREKSWRTVVVRDLFSLAPTFPGWLRGQAGSGPPGHLAGLQHVPGTPMRAPCPGGSDFPALLFSEAAQTAGLCQKESPGQALQGRVL